MAAPITIRNFNVFLDGRSWVGVVKTGKLPAVTIQAEDFRGAGMEGPIQIDMGLEAMTAELEFKEHNPTIVTLFGTRPLLVLRASAMGQDSFDAQAHVYTMRGLFRSKATGDFGAGSDVMMTATMGVEAFKHELDGEVLMDIDLVSGRRIIGGVDQGASQRAALGI